MVAALLVVIAGANCLAVGDNANAAGIILNIVFLIYFFERFILPFSRN